jgi:predicted nucleotidyltransferase
MANIFHPDFSEFVALLNDHNIEYLIVSGYAVSFHGYVRATGDIDIWIKPSESNAERIIEVLHKFGFGSFNLTVNDFMKADNVIQLGYEPVRIDLMTGVSGLTFDDCYTRKIRTEIAGLEMNYISLSDLKINKAATARRQDLLDLDNLAD